MEDGHIKKCVNSLLVPEEEGWTPPRVHLDMVVGSRPPKCTRCNRARPLHYPGDCEQAFYESPRIPCLICGEEDHTPEQCPIPGTSVLGRETLKTLYSHYLTSHCERGQCYICKRYHLPEGKYGDQHTTTAKCLHSLLETGKPGWDQKKSMLERSKDHRNYLCLPEPKRQKGPNGRPLQQISPEKRWTVEKLDKIFKDLHGQRSVLMTFQLT